MNCFSLRRLTIHTLYLPIFWFWMFVSCPSLPFIFAAFVPNVLARLTSLSPVCSKHIHALFSFFLFHFAVIHHSTATKAENKASIRLEAMCSLRERWHLVVEAENRGTGWNTHMHKRRTSWHLELYNAENQSVNICNLENNPNAEQVRGTHTTLQTSKDACNRYLSYFSTVRRRRRPWFF